MKIRDKTTSPYSYTLGCYRLLFSPFIAFFNLQTHFCVRTYFRDFFFGKIRFYDNFFFFVLGSLTRQFRMFKWKVSGLGGVGGSKKKEASSNAKLNNASSSNIESQKNNKNKEQLIKDQNSKKHLENSRYGSSSYIIISTRLQNSKLEFKEKSTLIQKYAALLWNKSVTWP